MPADEQRQRRSRRSSARLFFRDQASAPPTVSFRGLTAPTRGGSPLRGGGAHAQPHHNPMKPLGFLGRPASGPADAMPAGRYA